MIFFLNYTFLKKKKIRLNKKLENECWTLKKKMEKNVNIFHLKTLHLHGYDPNEAIIVRKIQNYDLKSLF